MRCDNITHPQIPYARDGDFGVDAKRLERRLISTQLFNKCITVVRGVYLSFRKCVTSVYLAFRGIINYASV